MSSTTFPLSSRTTSVYLDNGAALGIHFNLHRLHMRVDHAPLPRPVSPHSLVPVDIAAFHPVGPDHVGMHQRQHGVELPRIEPAISGGQDFPVAAGHIVGA